MGQPGAYLKHGRKEHGLRPAAEAVLDFEDIAVDLPASEQRIQASRCMNCGVPFCQSGLCFPGASRATGCPLHNLIPETNDLLFQGRWDEAAARLGLTNPFPEFTGRVCPAPCETACNLGLHDGAVTIHDNERALADYLWSKGIDPLPAAAPDAPLVSVIGSGPAGLAAAWELTRRGLRVRVYERDGRPGGMLMYGIPNMKLPKSVVERRCALMEASGVEFLCGVDAAQQADEIIGQSDAVIMACGARAPRNLDVPGMGLPGVCFALEYLSEATEALLEGRPPSLTAEGKDVAVIGGGDTGVDCVATALRQGARSVRQIIRARRPAGTADALECWPGSRPCFAQGYGQSEAEAILGCDPRLWSTDTVGFAGDAEGVASVAVRPLGPDGAEGEVPAQLVLIAKGFTGPEVPVIEAFSACPNLFLAGDAHLGPGLVATAIADGLAAAEQVAAVLAP